MVLNLVWHLFGSAQTLGRRFRQYAKLYYDFLTVAEHRATALAETAQVANAWRVSFALQRALKERQVLRVEFLVDRHKQSYFDGKSLDEIAARVDGQWSHSEERDSVGASDRYSTLSNLILDLESKFDSDTLMKHRDGLSRDSQYCAAREKLAIKVHDLSKDWLRK